MLDELILEGYLFLGILIVSYLFFSAFPAFAVVAFDALVAFGASTFCFCCFCCFRCIFHFDSFVSFASIPNVGSLTIRNIPTKSRSQRSSLLAFHCLHLKPSVVQHVQPIHLCCARSRSHPGLRSFLEKQLYDSITPQKKKKQSGVR